MSVTGRTISLSGGRFVFLGYSDRRDGDTFLAFRNEDGDDTKLILSGEAHSALFSLLSDPTTGLPVASFPKQGNPLDVVWQVVEPESTP